MAQTNLRLHTRVLAGNQVMFVSPELHEGEEIELIVLRSKTQIPQSTSTETEPSGELLFGEILRLGNEWKKAQYTESEIEKNDENKALSSNGLPQLDEKNKIAIALLQKWLQEEATDAPER